jgi:hypothetical protein
MDLTKMRDGLEAYWERYNEYRDQGLSVKEAREKARTRKKPVKRIKYTDDELHERFQQMYDDLLLCRTYRKEAIKQIEKCDKEEKRVLNASRQIDRREKKKPKIVRVMGPEIKVTEEGLQWKQIKNPEFLRKKIKNTPLNELHNRETALATKRAKGIKLTKEEEQEFEMINQYLSEFSDNRRQPAVTGKKRGRPKKGVAKGAAKKTQVKRAPAKKRQTKKK